MKSLLDFKSIIEEEKADYSKFDTLVRAGLANKAQMQRIHKILDKMSEDRPQFNNADRMIIQNLFNKMVDLISNNKAINMQARRAVKEDIEESVLDTSDFKVGPSGRKVRAHRIKIGDKGYQDPTVEEKLSEAQSKDGPTPPYVLLLKRKAIRLYPDGTKIALYYNKQINKFFSVPYDTPTGTAIQAEEVEQIDEIGDPAEMYRKATETAKAKLQTMKALDKTREYEKKRLEAARLRTQKEEVEITEAVMDQLHKIVNNKSAQSVKFASGHTRKIDHFTASAITQVHKALNDDNKKKFADMVHKSPEHFMKASDFAFKHAK
jgi:hypothetical protein